MSAAVQRLYAVQEQASDPLTIPAAPVAVPRPDLLDTEAVYRGAVDTANLIGFIRDDGLVSGDLIARTRGNASSPADIKRFTQRCDALTWLARSVDGVVPRKKWQRKTLAAAALLACLTAPAVAQVAVVDTDAVQVVPWVRPVADGEAVPVAPPAEASETEKLSALIAEELRTRAVLLDILAELRAIRTDIDVAFHGPSGRRRAAP